MSVGVDTGGTFTDFVWLDEKGRLQIHKQLSTLDDPSVAVLTGIGEQLIAPTMDVIHGSTVATNALLERRGARTALITTAGFADVLAIGRQNRPDLYALVPQKQAPLVPQAWRFEAIERVTAQGEVLTPLAHDELKMVLDKLAMEGIESVAVCFLFSFLYAEHEQQVATMIKANPALSHCHISLSSEILPEYREYERTATTVINAYVAPLVNRYLTRLAAGVAPRRLTVMQSNGGVINAETAASQAARTALSGPAGGVVGARFIASRAGMNEGDGFRHIITLDMGGTSSDVALCPGRLPTTATGSIVDMPLRLPLIDIHTVGAGGGSLAMLDAGGALHVGPASAGAVPGPACYNKSLDSWYEAVAAKIGVDGVQPAWATTTDANLVLGRLQPNYFLGGRMKLYKTQARHVLRSLAEVLNSRSPERAAWDVIQVANSNMERAIRHISVERGHDPRNFTLVAFGGAGPLHACELAQNLGMPRVLVPTVPGVLSALGMLVAAPTKDYSQTVMRLLDDEAEDVASWITAVFAPLEQRAMTEMMAEGHVPEAVTLRYALDMRYVGQSHELTIDYLGETRAATLTELFHITHSRRYGYQQTGAMVEIVTVRLTAVVPATPPIVTPSVLVGTDASEALLGEKRVWFASYPMLTRFYDRTKLQPGHRFAGPAIVFQYDTTTVVPQGWQTAVDGYGNLIITYDA